MKILSTNVYVGPSLYAHFPVIRHHVDIAPKWSRDILELPKAPWIEHVDFAIQEDHREMARQARYRDTKPIVLIDTEIDQLAAFLKSLTGM